MTFSFVFGFLSTSKKPSMTLILSVSSEWIKCGQFYLVKTKETNMVIMFYKVTVDTKIANTELSPSRGHTGWGSWELSLITFSPTDLHLILLCVYFCLKDTLLTYIVDSLILSSQPTVPLLMPDRSLSNICLFSLKNTSHTSQPSCT